MRLTTKIGSGFVLVGLVLFGGWVLYLGTRHYVPIDMPVAMSVGHIRTREFTVNVSDPYEIEIEVEKKIPFDTLNCLLGMSPSSQEDCSDSPAVVNASWVLLSDGKIAQSGSSADDKGGAWASDTISREIGRFDGKAGHTYRLEVDILADGTRLALGDPHLKVSVTSDFVEGAMFETALLIDPAAGVLVLIGVVLLIVCSRRTGAGVSSPMRRLRCCISGHERSTNMNGTQIAEEV